MTLDVALDRRPADTILANARICDVLTAAITPGRVGIAAGRVCFVDYADEPTPRRHGGRVINLEGQYLLPALVEAHGHGDIVFTPEQLCRQLADHGTSLVVLELLSLVLLFDTATVSDIIAASRSWPTKVLWSLRPHVDGFHKRLEREALDPGRLEQLYRDHDEIVSYGELVAWQSTIDGVIEGRGDLGNAIDHGLRVDGHAPGASHRTLDALACLGLTSDHEAIDGPEALARLRRGMWVMARSSSLRRDIPAITEYLIAQGVSPRRLVLTTDGPTAGDLVTGSASGLAAIRDAMTGGLSPIDAIASATLVPATYLGLDAHVGAIAPGRAADMVVVDDLPSMLPSQVFLDGQEHGGGGHHERGQRPSGFDWASAPPTHPLGPLPGMSPELLCGVATATVLVRLDGVVTRRVADSGTAWPEGTSHCLLISRRGDWITGMGLLGFDVPAFVSTFTAAGHVLLLGTDPSAMCRLYDEALRLGGAIGVPSRLLGLDVGGLLSSQPLDQIAGAIDALTGDLPPLPAPIEFLALFLAMAAIPEVRLTPSGVVDVKRQVILAPPLTVKEPIDA